MRNFYIFIMIIKEVDMRLERKYSDLCLFLIHLARKFSLWNIHCTLYWMVLGVDLTQSRVIREQGVLVEEMFPCDPVVSHFLNYSSMGSSLDECCLPKLVVLDTLRKTTNSTNLIS